MSSKINEYAFEYSHDTIAFVLMEMLQVSKFVVTVYDNSWFVGMIEGTFVDNRDVLIKFMSLAGPALSFE